MAIKIRERNQKPKALSFLTRLNWCGSRAQDVNCIIETGESVSFRAAKERSRQATQHIGASYNRKSLANDRLKILAVLKCQKIQRWTWVNDAPWDKTSVSAKDKWKASKLSWDCCKREFWIRREDWDDTTLRGNWAEWSDRGGFYSIVGRNWDSSGTSSVSRDWEEC